MQTTIPGAFAPSITIGDFPLRRFSFPLTLGCAGLCVLLLPRTAGAQTTFTNTNGGNYTVPAGVTSLLVQLWGAGGEGVSYQASPTSIPGGGSGGGGAYLTGNLVVTPGEQLRVFIGSGGFGGGGGASFSYISDISSNFTLVTVGAGGSGGTDGDGGAGGITAGHDGLSAAAGGHGAPFSGVSGNGGGDFSHQGSPGSTGGVGYQPTFGSGVRAGRGGDGGGGFGSGGGGGYDTATDFFGGGGGGASDASNLTNSGGSQDGNGATSGGINALHYIAGVGMGGTPNLTGGDGEVVITAVSSATPEPSSVALFIGLAGSGMISLRKRRKK
jgi:hypothetical protein